MKKLLLWLFISLWFGFGTLFAQNILPDSAEIEVKSPVIQWEATNLKITMKKGWTEMRSYTGVIFIEVTDENWVFLRENERTLPNNGVYTFLSSDLWSKEFQKWLEIKKEWLFYIQVSDFNDDSDKILGKQLVRVVKSWQWNWNYRIEVLNPEQNSILTSEKVEIIAQVPDLPNSNILVYIDDNLVSSTPSDSAGSIFHTIANIGQWKHTLRLESPDIEWNILWSSDKIQFSFSPISSEWVKKVEVKPEEWLKVWDLVDIIVYTDEMVESVKMTLSDRSENESIILTKDWNWIFHQKVFLIANWEVSISVETSSSNNSISKKYENIKKFFVGTVPEIDNVKTEVDEWNKSAVISRNTLNGEASSFLIDYWVENSNLSWQEWTDSQTFTFNDVPYDTVIFLTITPYRDNSKKHWAASKTIQFVISKPTTSSWSSLSLEWSPYTPKCTIQNISTRTTKVWGNYYLMWDKVENVSKYIIYSSTNQLWTDKVKVYETTDTSYEYPFDKTSEEDKFAYFRIVWVCDDWEELELSWATKVQVWPAENFFLLLCVTLLIYFWIKLFRETEI